ncbi:AAR2 domain containing protein [Moelleriella libera RCEF 2490]|uniref:AAR2 domain containing protein n=1 Tax=Moelleriella libera RCEF 2490 TaxID=1081109 RepID=A0A168A233_9HYPO|nr:AAR2 domain containing protein [Moelleriella libera RCEF 2490]
MAAAEDSDDRPPPLESSPGDDSCEAGDTSATCRQVDAVSPRRQIHSQATGDAVLIHDLPEVFHVGYDAASFTAQRFTCLKDIPAGPHFLWVAHPSGVAARAGVWLLADGTRPPRTHVLTWDQDHELLRGGASRPGSLDDGREISVDISGRPAPHSQLSDASKARDRLSASEFQANLDTWRQLTSHVTRSVLDRVAGAQEGDGWFVHTLDRAEGASQSRTQSQLERTILIDKTSQHELKFTISRSTRLFRLEPIGPERTSEALDPTTYLLSYVQSAPSSFTDQDLVGELQFSFVVGLLLGNDDCLDQWWFMVLKLVAKSYLLVQKQPLLSAALWRAVTAQIEFGMKWTDSTMFDRTEHNCRELRISLIVYKRRVEEFLHADEGLVHADHLAVSATFSRLESTLAELGWDLSGDYLRKGKVTLEDGEEVELELSELEAEDERGEWAPAIVELNEREQQLLVG